MQQATNWNGPQPRGVAKGGGGERSSRPPPSSPPEPNFYNENM